MEARTQRCAATVVLLLAGCAGEVPLGQPGVTREQVTVQADSLRATARNRDQVHALLGEPAIASPDASAEVFRTSSTQHQLLLLFAPWPIPLPAPGIRHDGYTLVTYDRDGTVQGVDAGFRSSDFGALEAGVLLRAGDHEFLHGRDDLLLVSLERYGVGQPAAADEACTVLVACELECPDEPGNASACGVCWTRLRIDVGPVRELPLVRFAMWRVDVDAAGSAASAAAPAAADRCRDLGGRVVGGFCQALRWPLVPLKLPPGHHTFVATSRWFDGEARGEHACAAGELVYLTLGGELAESYSLARQLGARLHTGYATGRMTFSPEVPDALAGRRVVLRP